MLPTVLAPDCPSAPSFPARRLVHYPTSRHPPNMQHRHLSQRVWPRKLLSALQECLPLFLWASSTWDPPLSPLAKGYSHKPHTFENITPISQKSRLSSQPKYPPFHGLLVSQCKFLFTALASPTRLGAL